jgi:hypothetical protein
MTKENSHFQGRLIAPLPTGARLAACGGNTDTKAEHYRMTWIRIPNFKFSLQVCTQGFKHKPKS